MPPLSFAIVLTFLMVPTLAPTVESNTQPETAEALEINGHSAITPSAEGLAVHYPAGRWSVETQEIDDHRSLVRWSWTWQSRTGLEFSSAWALLDNRRIGPAIWSTPLVIRVTVRLTVSLSIPGCLCSQLRSINFLHRGYPG